MGLRRNILATYANQAYVTLVTFLTVPFYIRYMGTEAYGLVGFFVMLQAWFMLLDLGLTPTVARQAARYKGDAVAADEFLSLVKALQYLFAAVGIVGGAALFLSADWLATRWLNAQTLPIAQVRESLQIISVIIALRWMGGVYRSVISGVERLVWLASFGSAMATLRTIGVIAVLNYVDARPTTFFAFQLFTALMEFTGLAVYAWHQMPKPSARKISLWQGFLEARQLIKFSLSLAFTASLWVFVTQSDKLVLSKVLSLADYGFFTLAVMAASGVTTMATPISAALMPRMARLEAEGKRENLILLYRESTQFITVLALSAALTLAFLAHPILFGWTGNTLIADSAAPVLAWYALGNGMLALSAFPYYLQYATGDLRLHVIGNALYVAILVPLIVYAARRWGGPGAGIVWLAINFLYLAAWTPVIHRRIHPGLNRHWFTRDIMAVALPLVVVGTTVSMPMSSAPGRLFALVDAAVLFAAMVAVGLACTSAGQRRLAKAWQRSLRSASARRR